MTHLLYDRKHANELLPLLRSISRELLERSAELARIESLIELAEGGRHVHAELSDLIASAATHRRELRHARKELEKLGCSIVGTAPLTIRIPGRRGARRRSFVYQTGRAALS